MKEAYASFPPISAQKTLVTPTTETNTINATGYLVDGVSNNRFRAAQEVRIDLRGLAIDDKVLKINNIHVARMPCFDNTFPKSQDVSTNPQAGIYHVVDMHLVTTSPIVYTPSTDRAGSAPAQNELIQLEDTLAAFASVATNNGYGLPTPGLIQGDSIPSQLEGLNLDPNMIVFCQTDVLTGNVRSNANLQSMLVPIDSSVYGMGDMAALDTLHCYRFIYGEWTSQAAVPLFSGSVGCSVGPSIIQMSTQVSKPSDIMRLSIMDQNFNTTNPLVE